MKRRISFLLNGEPTDVDVDPRRKLLWVLRTELGLTGTKYGCGERECGACTVLVDGRRVFSCDTNVSAVNDREVTTIEGLADGDELHPVQKESHDELVRQSSFDAGEGSLTVPARTAAVFVES